MQNSKKNNIEEDKAAEVDPGGQSSGILQSGQHASKGARQQAQQSSLTSHFHVATACQRLILTFMFELLPSSNPAGTTPPDKEA